MTASTRHDFDAQDLTIAVAVAVLAQLGFVAAFSMPSPKLVEAEISNDNAQPIAVSITPQAEALMTADTPPDWA